MALKIKKRDFIFLLSSFLIAIPLIIAGLTTIPAALGAINRSYFTVEVTVSGGAPVVYYVNFSDYGNLVDAGVARYNFVFNVTDQNGVDDIIGVVVNLTLGRGSGALQAYNNSQCNTTATSGNVAQYNCSVILNYWFNASSAWNITITARDSGSLTGTNASVLYTINSLTAMRLEKNGVVNFSSGVSAGSSNVAATSNPFIINNTGNFDFSRINITGQNLTGVSDPTKYLGPGNVTVNATSAAGVPLGSRDNGIIIPDANLTHANAESGSGWGYGNLSLYFYISIPSGTAAQVYNTTDYWQITLN